MSSSPECLHTLSMMEFLKYMVLILVLQIPLYQNDTGKTIAQLLRTRAGTTRNPWLMIVGRIQIKKCIVIVTSCWPDLRHTVIQSTIGSWSCAHSGEQDLCTAYGLFHILMLNLLEGDEPRGVGGSNTGTSVPYRLVWNGKLAEVMGHHLRLHVTK